MFQAVMVVCLCGPLAAPQQRDLFEQRVRPLLSANCAGCHGAQKQRGGLRLDSPTAIERGGKSGPVVVPGQPNRSRLILAVQRTSDLKMPPDRPLSQAEIETLTQWIKSGATWPDYAAQQGPPNRESVDAIFTDEERRYWAFQPVRFPRLPVVQSGTQPRTPVDPFILRRLTAEGLATTLPANRRQLIRRIYFDLLGLPPPASEVAAFVGDRSPTACEELIDRLLASPHYGERWGRHWLDVVRYADTTANDGNYIMRYAYRYRDYVVQALNDDRPYNRFILEQLAGDLLAPEDNPGRDHQRIIATGFLLLGPKALAEQDKKQLLLDIADEQIDVTSRAFLGLTVACARCHDHKFDPIPTADYYSWAGIFRSTRVMSDTAFVSKWLERPLSPVKRPAPMFLVEPTAALNLARRGTARQSTENAGNFPADLATDGVPGNFSHTADGDPSPWWEVELAKPSPIRLITLWNRTDCCASRLSNFRVRVLAADRQEVFRHDFFTDGKKFPPANRGLYIELPAGIAGQTVRVELLGPNATGEHWLQLAEVEVYANQPAPPPLPDEEIVMAVEEGTPADLAIHRRGNHKTLGPLAPRRFLQILDGTQTAFQTTGSGRLELARRIARPENPLTARVMVNRIWQGHFGTGLVATSDNFGRLGEPPSHPELLDWLAAEFVHCGWSVKRLHRVLMHAAIYRQRSQPAPSPADTADRRRPQTIDPDNRLLWKFPRRRLSAEELRDALLAIAGQLDPSVGGSIFDWRESGGLEDEKRGLYSASKAGQEYSAYQTRRRSIYLPVVRNSLYNLFELFDFANANAVTTRRGETTVAPQALFLMNSPFVHQQAQHFATELLRDAVNSQDKRLIGRAHEAVLGRQPTADERAEAARFIEEAMARFSKEQPGSEPPRSAAWASYCQLLFGLSEFSYVD